MRRSLIALATTAFATALSAPSAGQDAQLKPAGLSQAGPEASLTVSPAERAARFAAALKAAGAPPSTADKPPPPVAMQIGAGSPFVNGSGIANARVREVKTTLGGGLMTTYGMEGTGSITFKMNVASNTFYVFACTGYYQPGERKLTFVRDNVRSVVAAEPSQSYLAFQTSPTQRVTNVTISHPEGAWDFFYCNLTPMGS